MNHSISAGGFGDTTKLGRFMPHKKSKTKIIVTKRNRFAKLWNYQWVLLPKIWQIQEGWFFLAEGTQTRNFPYQQEMQSGLTKQFLVHDRSLKRHFRNFACHKKLSWVPSILFSWRQHATSRFCDFVVDFFILQLFSDKQQKNYKRWNLFALSKVQGQHLKQPQTFVAANYCTTI